ncbi:MAG: endonuclease MutS2, partial [Treponema sp.]|nr:endonuclease MutS2 [Treponema sp.]
MNGHLSGQTAQELDFYRIRAQVAGLAASEEGKSLLAQREPTADREEIEKLKELGKEWATYLKSARPSPLQPWPAVKDSFKLLAVAGAQLSQGQAFALGLMCQSVGKIREAISGAATSLPLKRLEEKAQTMPDLSKAATEIFSILDKDGEVRDLPALRAIRNRIRELQKEAEGAIRKYTSDNSQKPFLQSNVPVMRGDRQLLAVRADRRGTVSGIIHEVSASGQTLYIEPEEAVRANNELVQEEAHLANEIKKILRDLTEKLAPYKEELIQAHGLLLQMDTSLAAARYLVSLEGTFADSCDRSNEPPLIKAARHPLLGPKAVPVDISFMDGKDILIITGPNTGGKTVTLKTVALFCLMNQAGFPVPADEGTRLPVFNSVFADIGDEQSIDESLSTFSSHMKKMAHIIECAGRDSLVLLDELATGTDPQEGGAIAMAVLDTLIERGSFVLVTTHHGILKNYGYTNPSCVNASVEFDPGTLSPTYRLVMGVPGESHAMDIARRSGLPEHIVTKAQEYIAGDKADVSALIKGLTEKHAEIDAMLREERIKNAELATKTAKLNARSLEIRKRELELRELDSEKESRFLVQTRSRLENLVREIREGEITREKTLKVRSFIDGLEKDMEERDKQLEADRQRLEAEEEKLREEERLIAENGMRLSKARDGSHAQTSKKKTKRKMSAAEAFALASVPEKKKTDGKSGSKAQDGARRV